MLQDPTDHDPLQPERRAKKTRKNTQKQIPIRHPRTLPTSTLICHIFVGIFPTSLLYNESGYHPSK